MNPIDILGDLLGHKTSRSSHGGDILKDMFGRGGQHSTRTTAPSSNEIQRQAQELEDLLNVANDRRQQRRSDHSWQAERPISHAAPTSPGSSRSYERAAPPAGRSRTSPSFDASVYDAPVAKPPAANSPEERAVILIRAMINAAKADGKLDSDEQQKIFDRLGRSSVENIEFIRREFARPLDLNDFVRSVPVGMEQQVYTMSLIAIDLDSGKEASYLVDLAERLRIPAEVREQIHQRVGAPSVY